MKIHLRQIPAGGLHLEGDEECSLPELDSQEVRCAGPLHYILDVGVSEGALWANGELIQPVELRCVRCLEAFPFEIKVPHFTVHLPLTGPEEIDLTPFLREDVLLNLPAYPHCDREGGRICPVPAVKSGESEDSPEKRAADWSALDELKIRRS
ncbi:MAG TPA: hypothetical protein VGI60_03960 [Chthoniobacterales bacterium]|jgi:uncharacterized protein